MPVLFVDPGQFRTPLLLEAAQLSPDGAGGHAETWVEIASIQAQLEPVASLSRFAAAQMIEETTHRITMRYRGGVLAGMRFRKGERQFDIVTVHDPDETGRYLVCLVREALQ